MDGRGFWFSYRLLELYMCLADFKKVKNVADITVRAYVAGFTTLSSFSSTVEQHIWISAFLRSTDGIYRPRERVCGR